MLLHVLQQRAAGAVDDALGRAGGARGKHDHQWVVEGHPHEVDRPALFRCECRTIEGSVTHAVERRRLFHVWHNNHMLDGGKLGQDLLHLRPAVEGLAAIEVAIGGDQHLGFDLTEAVEDTARAEIRRARRPDGAEARGG